MRFVIAATAAAAVLLAAAAAQAEKRMFIIANDGDGYGVDRCLASGAPCGDAGGERLLQVAPIRPGAVVPQGRPRRHHRRHPDERPDHLQRRQLRQLRRHRVLALNLTAPARRRLSFSRQQPIDAEAPGAGRKQQNQPAGDRDILCQENILNALRRLRIGPVAVRGSRRNDHEQEPQQCAVSCPEAQHQRNNDDLFHRDRERAHHVGAGIAERRK